MARRLSVALALLSLGGARPAVAEVPDPYTFTLENSPSPEPPRAAAPPRAEPRRFVVGVETGWNGLTGFGLSGSWRPNLRLAVDGGVGVGALTWKGGVRARVMSGEGRTALTGGIALLAQGGVSGDVAEGPGPVLPLVLYAGVGTRSTPYTVTPAALLQVTAGLQLRRGGFDATILLGWAQVVAGRRVRSAEPLGDEQRAWVDGVTGGGPVVEVTLGHAWGG